VGVSRFELLITLCMISILILVEWSQRYQTEHPLAQQAVRAYQVPAVRWIALNILIGLTLLVGQFAGRQFIYFQF
jgi:hypothetical protein